MAERFLAGHFLVASRHLRDPNFVRSVVLMIHHSDEGAMGAVG
jgi:putative transcriptional regulator